MEPYFLGAARFSLRFSFNVFCACFFCSFFGFSEPFTASPLWCCAATARWDRDVARYVGRSNQLL